MLSGSKIEAGAVDNDLKEVAMSEITECRLKKEGMAVTHREVETHLSIFAEAETEDRQVPWGLQSHRCVIHLSYIW